MKRHNAGSAKIDNKSLNTIANTSGKAIDDLWKTVNSISDKVNTSMSGNKGSAQDKVSKIRFVQDGDGYYIEVKFDNGWARLPQSMVLIDKR